MPDSANPLLPDVGNCSYNGVVWKTLYKSKATGTALPDNAGRTVKTVEWAIEVEGVVTLLPGETSTDNRMQDIRQRLETFGGTLQYQSKGLGNNLIVNQPGNPVRDVAWGPKTKVVDFKPLGGARGALVTWTVTTQIPELKNPVAVSLNRGALLTVLQFNQEIDIAFDDDCYASRTIKGTLEIPLTRSVPGNRTVVDTVDAYRDQFLNLPVDLTRFRVTHRTFNISRDRRTCEWNFVIEELPPMGLPPGCSSARGTCTVRPYEKSWAVFPFLVSLRATYTVRKDQPRRAAWWAFLALLKYRMEQSVAGNDPKGANPPVNAQNPQGVIVVPEAKLSGIDQREFLPLPPVGTIQPTLGTKQIYAAFFRALQNKFGALQNVFPGNRKCFLLHFGVDEGLYLDSKTISFEASWQLMTTLTHVMLAAGIWRQSGVEGGRAWAASMQDIQGSSNWIPNNIDQTADIIVDLGGP